MKKKYEVLKIMESLQDTFVNLLEKSDTESQILYPGSDKPLVRHQYTQQITYVKDGRGLTCLNGECIGINKGDLITMEAQTSHSFLAQSEELHLIHWHWPKDKLEEDREILESFCNFGGMIKNK